PTDVCSPCPFTLTSFSRSRSLHSFPTRRSSDLIIALDQPDGSVDHVRPPVAKHGARVIHERGESSALDVNLRNHLGARHRRMQLDRKSTRLNSSHVAISYAVFCLKKKNTADLQL